MARKKKSVADAVPSPTIDGVPYEVHDAYHTLMRAREITGNKKLMGHVKKHAVHMAKKSTAVAHHATMLAKSGHISDKQMTKLTKMRSVA